MTEWRRCRENCLPCTARITPAVLPSASTSCWVQWVASSRAADMDRPAMADQASRSCPRLGVQAIANSLGVLKCQRHQRCRDVARHRIEHDSYLLRHVVEVISGTKRVDGIVGQRMGCHGDIFHMAGWTVRACGRRKGANSRKRALAGGSGGSDAPAPDTGTGACGFTPGSQPRAASVRGCGRGRCIRARTHGCAMRRSRWRTPCA